MRITTLELKAMKSLQCQPKVSFLKYQMLLQRSKEELVLSEMKQQSHNLQTKAVLLLKTFQVEPEMNMIIDLTS